MSHPADRPRFDPVTPVHKAMRRFMFDVLTETGALDVADMFAVDRCARQVTRLAAVLADAGSPLLPLVHALRQREPDARRDAATALYRALTALVTSQLVAQQDLEATRTPALWVAHSDLDLAQMRRDQLAAMSEEEIAEALRWMGAALTPPEFAAFVGDLQASVDPQAFGCLLDTLRRQLDGVRWARLARELGLPGAVSTVCVDDDPTQRSEARRLHRAERHRLLV